MMRHNLSSAGHLGLQGIVTEGAEPLRWMIEEHAKLKRELGPLSTVPTIDGLLTLKDAATLPELGGVISIKTLRSAIARGHLKGCRPNGPKATMAAPTY